MSVIDLLQVEMLAYQFTSHIVYLLHLAVDMK